MKLLAFVFTILICIPVLAQNQTDKIRWINIDLTSTFYQGFTTKAEFGTLSVQENRIKPNHSGKIELAFIRFKATTANPGSPIVFLAGGPGNSGISVARGELLPVFLKLREVCDVIVLDQRGTGQSKPSLQFSGGQFILPLQEPVFSAASQESLMKSAQAWAIYLKNKNIDISAYNTNENAEDLEDLRKNLNTEKLNIWGFSYGTHLSLAYLKKYERHVNRAILGGINGLDQRYRYPEDGDELVKKISAIVKQTPKLGNEIPEVYGLAKKVMSELAEKPVTVNQLPGTNEKVNIYVGKEDLQIALALISGQSWFARELPAFLYNMLKGNTAFAGLYVRDHVKNPNAHQNTAMMFSMHCASGLSENRKKEIQRQSQKSLFGNAVNFPFMQENFCNCWEVNDLGEEFRQPVKTNVPTLFLNGELDGRTSLKSAKEVKKGFINGHLITVTNAAHDIWLVSPEIPDIMVSFFKGNSVSQESVAAPAIEFRSVNEAQIVDRLYQTLISEGIDRMHGLFDDMRKPSSDIYVNSLVLQVLINKLLREQKKELAIQVLELSARIYPANWRFSQQAGEMYTEQNNTEKAFSYFQQSLTMNPYNLKAQIGIEKIKARGKPQ